MSNDEFIKHLASVLGATPVSSSDYRTAFTHPSGNAKSNYQRLEFLGDAVLNLAVSHVLYERLPGESEGFLTKERIRIVRQEALARYCEFFGLKDHIVLGRSEKADKGLEKESILADVFEAFIAAAYLDKGFDFIRDWVRRNYDALELLRGDMDDYKSLLQEFTQKASKQTPEYLLTAEDGEAHRKRFFVDVMISGSKVSEGAASTKKAAEQDAARKALYLLTRHEE